MYDGLAQRLPLPGPNRYGYDPTSSYLLEPKRPLPGPGETVEPIWIALEHWRSLDTFRRRRRIHPEQLAYRRGRKVVVVRYRHHKSGARVSLMHRFLCLLFKHVDVRHLVVGRRDAAGDLRPFRREELAAELGLNTYERNGVWHCDQIDRLISDARAAGYIWRHQGRQKNNEGQPRGKVAILKLTRFAFIVSGAAASRERFLKRQENRITRRAAAAAGARQRRAPDVQRVVAELAHGHSDPDQRRKRPPPGGGG